MEQIKKQWIHLRCKACQKALQANHVQAYIVENAAQACKLVDAMIENGTQVCDGGSMTLKETGILSMLEKRSIYFRSHNDTTLSRTESDEEMRKAFTADTFLCSSNAITLQGELINVDGHGNRVSAMIFGPRQVIIVAGFNKIVADEEAARQRIRQVAAPTNSIRLNKKTPCRFLGTCKDCHSQERICSSYVKINYDKEDRLRVILIEEAFGY